MKKILNILTLCCCIFWAACSDDDNPASSGIQVVSTSDIDFTAAGGEGTIVVNAAGAVSATSDKEWCTVTVEGTTVHVVAAASTEMTSRSALITISSGTESAQVPVIQQGQIVVVNEYNLYHAFKYEGGSLTYPFKTNSTYTIEYPEEAKSWLTCEVDEAKNLIIFTVARNEDHTPRGAEVKITVGTKETVLGISQIEVQEAQLAGTWNCSYVSSAVGQPLSGEIPMINDPRMGLVMSDLAAAAQLGAPLPLLFEDGILYLKAETLGRFEDGSELSTGTVGADGLLYLSNCIAVPQYKDGQLVYHFGYSYNEALGEVGDMGFCLVVMQNGQLAQVMEIYDHFVISKALN